MCNCKEKCQGAYEDECFCTCHQAKRPLVLQVGKTYLNGYGNRLKAVAFSDGYFILQNTFINPISNQGKIGMTASYRSDGTPGWSVNIAHDGFIRHKIVLEVKEPQYWYGNVYPENGAIYLYDTEIKAHDSAGPQRRVLTRINKETFETEVIQRY